NPREVRVEIFVRDPNSGCHQHSRKLVAAGPRGGTDDKGLRCRFASGAIEPRTDEVDDVRSWTRVVGSIILEDLARIGFACHRCMLAFSTGPTVSPLTCRPPGQYEALRQ